MITHIHTIHTCTVPNSALVLRTQHSLEFRDGVLVKRSQYLVIWSPVVIYGFRGYYCIEPQSLV